MVLKSRFVRSDCRGCGRRELQLVTSSASGDAKVEDSFESVQDVVVFRHGIILGSTQNGDLYVVPLCDVAKSAPFRMWFVFVLVSCPVVVSMYRIRWSSLQSRWGKWVQ